MSNEKMREALRSIANSTCCGRCQEAALVARAALATQRQAEPVGSAADEVTDAQRLAWLLPNLHPANFGMEFPGGYEWEDEADYLRKWRGAIDAAMQKDTQ
jgi:hypothetical protein